MGSALADIPLRATMAGFRRFSVPEYHRLAEIGVLTEDDNLELLEGYLVHKMSRNPPHDGTLCKIMMRLLRELTSKWILRSQSAVTLPGSVPEPDLAIVRANATGYMTQHPVAEDIGLLIEISDSTLLSDRADKCRIYARANVPTYWIVNLLDRQIEVYTQPSGDTPEPSYAQRRDYLPGEMLPWALPDCPILVLPVSELLP